jgi:acylphosphatase
MHATRFLVSGIVQGVGFLYFTLRAARALGIRGYVRNLRDGRVEAVAAGPAASVEDFAAQIRRGPAGAAVRGVEREAVTLEMGDSGGFEIRD